MKGKGFLLFFLCSLLTDIRAFLLPLLFPVSIKISIHSNHKPTPPPHSYHFTTAPVYKEVVVKGSAHISPPKHSYGDGVKYGTSYGDGYVKVYTNEPHIKGHKYATGYAGCDKNGCGGYAYVNAPSSSGHYKGTNYPEAPHSQYDGHELAQYDKGTSYEDQGVHYVDSPHYKGTEYPDDQHDYHDKGTAYEDHHYKGTEYRASIPHPKDSPYVKRTPKKGHTRNSYLKTVGKYRMSDFLGAKTPIYQESVTEYATSHVAIPPKVDPGKTYAEIAEAHKSSYSPKAYSAEEYADLGAKKFKSEKDYEHASSYLDDSLPYKPNIPRPQQKYNARQRPSRYDEEYPTEEPASYGGYGTSIYGDSYAKVVYQPKSLRISIRAYSH